MVHRSDEFDGLDRTRQHAGYSKKRDEYNVEEDNSVGSYPFPRDRSISFESDHTKSPTMGPAGNARAIKIPRTENSAVVIEGSMYKANKRDKWAERYFRFKELPDGVRGTLEWWHSKNSIQFSRSSSIELDRSGRVARLAVSAARTVERSDSVWSSGLCVWVAHGREHRKNMDAGKLLSGAGA